MSKFVVGQEVRIFSMYGLWGVRRRLGQPGVVTKVGRTVCTVTQIGDDGEPCTGWDTRFDMESGDQKRGANAAGIGDRVKSLADVAIGCHRSRLVAVVESHGLKFDGWVERDFPTSKLVAVADALAESR